MAADKVAEAVALMEVQSQARQQIVDMAQAAVVAEVRLFAAWYSADAITSLAGRLAKLVRAGQKQTATGTDAYASRLLQLLTGRRVPPVGPIPVDDLRGLPLESVYGRLADQYRYLHATRGLGAPVVDRVSEEGEPLPPLPRLSDEAILERVVTLAETQTEDNLSLAFRDQWAADMGAAPVSVVGYRRIIRPELAKSKMSCGLCVVASDQLYTRSDLLPLHGHCHCSVMPVIGEEGGAGDPGGEVNRKDLDRLYKAAGSTSGRDLKRVRIAVTKHGELGPTLVPATDRRTKVGANGKRRTGPASASEIQVSPERVLAGAEEAIAGLEKRAAGGEDVSGPLKYQRSLAARMRQRLEAA